MATFRFRLERVLGLSLARRDQRARQLGQARDAERQAARDLEARARVREDRLGDLRGEASGEALELDAWEAGRAHYQGLRGAETAAAGRLDQARSGVEAARAAWLDARREGAALERLRERRRMQWRATEAAAEQAGLDEAGTRRRTQGG